MSEREGKPVRRLRALRPEVTLETAATILPGSPRVGALDALLREVDSLRLTLETDLSIAAAAVEAGAPGIALDIIDSDREGLQAFEDRALGHLSVLSDAQQARRRRFRVPAVPFVAAAALVGFLVGVVPDTLSGPDQIATSAVAANGSLEQLQDFAANGSTSQVREAAETLHEQLLAVVAQAGSDPEAAQHALLLLSYERDAIVQSGDSDALHDVLLQSTALANKIRNALPATVRSGVPAAPVVAAPTTSASPAPKPPPSPKPSAAPKPSPKPSPSASPKPSSSPSSEPAVLPTANPAGGG